MRLNKYLAGCGLGSRRSCDSLVGSGRIYVNGAKVKALGVKVTVGKDRVEYLGRILEPVRCLRYIAFHKPQTGIAAESDLEKRDGMFDALRQAGCDADALTIIERPDAATEGLVLLTNDGSLVHALTHPRYQIKQVFDVQLDRKLSPDEVEVMTGPGVESEHQILCAGMIIQAGSVNLPWYRVELYNSKKRHLQRMFGAAGRAVLRSRRVQFASVKLGDLAPGAFRELTGREVAALRAAGFKPSPSSR
ncbi:MAG TPA: pseudouridine synthase [Chitinivibrionales bacterium]|nr:pseudouridine synthase [Chitinivibrionales bacterium]